jgi:hypothetical protein
MKAVLKQSVRPIRDRGLNELARSEPTRRLFLLFDSTIEVCPVDPVVYSRSVPGCIGKEALTLLNRLPGGPSRRLENLFTDRNSRPLPIRGILDDDVVYVPSLNVATPPRLGDFVRKYPRGSAVVVFSAPVYPGDGTALIFYHHLWNGGGFVHLRLVDKAWSPVKTSGWIE